MSRINDLTEGNVTKQLVGFALPVLFGALFQQFYSLVDTAIVGKTISVEALAAVGATGSITFLIIGFCNGMCSGFAIPIAQRFGARDERGLRRSVINSLFLSAIMAIVFTVLTVIFCMHILRLMNTPEDIIQMSYDYLVIIFWGIPVTVFYNLFAGIIRALGDSKTPLYFLIFSSVFNIGMDYLMIVGLHMGTAGAGVATVLSQFVAVILCGFVMWRNYPILHMNKDEIGINGDEIKILLGMGFPMGLQYSITAIGSLLFQTAVNGLGSLYVAAVTSASKISLFCMQPFDALGVAMATFAGQNLGARKPERIREGVRKALLIGAIYSIIAFLVLYFAGGTLALIFVEGNNIELIDLIATVLFWYSLFYVFLMILSVLRFSIQGMGYSFIAVLAGVMEMIARGIMGVAVIPKYGFIAACLASPLAWFGACVFLVPTYFVIINKVKERLSSVSKRGLEIE